MPFTGSKKVEFTYDYLGRRVRTLVYTHNGTAWPTTASADIRFVYDLPWTGDGRGASSGGVAASHVQGGWNLVMELDGLNGNAIQRKYTWDLDLSGTPQGAGGIGGLLAMQDLKGTASTADDASYLYFYDANGNVGQLIDPTGAVAAKYAYDPYGNLTLAVGDAAAANPFRFSTKYFDVETGLYYYGYRYYLPGLGRWGSRDPIGEAGGKNLMTFVANDPVGRRDILGLYCGSTWWQEIIVPDETHRRDIGKTCCKQHDDCYSRCGASRLACDQALAQCITAKCDSAGRPYKPFDGPLPGWKDLYNSCFPCKQVAEIFYNGVRGGGLSAFNNAQAQAGCKPRPLDGTECRHECIAKCSKSWLWPFYPSLDHDCYKKCSAPCQP